jgi:hypothetical protein
MGFILEIIIELALELGLEIVGEGLVELGFHSTAERLSKGKRNKLIVGSVYVVAGIVLGALSLLIFPLIVFDSILIVVTYFLVMPLFVGLSLSIVSWIINRGIHDVRHFEMDKIICGILFALAYSITRVLFG